MFLLAECFYRSWDSLKPQLTVEMENNINKPYHTFFDHTVPLKESCKIGTIRLIDWVKSWLSRPSKFIVKLSGSRIIQVAPIWPCVWCRREEMAGTGSLLSLLLYVCWALGVSHAAHQDCLDIPTESHFSPEEVSTPSTPSLTIKATILYCAKPCSPVCR